MNERLEAVVHGRVQGVGYRWFTVRTARSLELVGSVANLRDGSVRVVAEGPRERLDDLVVALREGPPGARVDDVAVQLLAASGAFGRFDVAARDHAGD